MTSMTHPPRHLLLAIGLIALAPDAPLGAQQPTATGAAPVTVTVQNFIRAETDLYFASTVKQAGLGRLLHIREPAPIEKQDVVRMNRDTLYSAGVFDLKAAPVTVTLPDTGGRFMTLLVVSQDHYNPAVVYAPGRFTFTEESVGTRYVMLMFRTLADPLDPADITKANALQDQIRVEQARPGTFEVPTWDPVSHKKVRDALIALGALRGDSGITFGTKEDVDPVLHLIGTANGWGGNPREAAVYDTRYPKANDGTTVHTLTVKDVPVDGFWSVCVYNAKGYFEKNDLDAYSLNNLTASKNADGSVTVQFGGCTKDTPNCLPITPGWNYTARQYRPRKAILDGSWTFPEARPVQTPEAR
jgi:para-nitrobenzyl esterase